jgi:hypothetical protein
MAIFNSYFDKLPEGIVWGDIEMWGKIWKNRRKIPNPFHGFQGVLFEEANIWILMGK